MEAIRQIVTPSTNHLDIIIPDNLVNEELEVIILWAGASAKPENNYKSLIGSVSENEARKMLGFIESSRNEWE